MMDVQIFHVVAVLPCFVRFIPDVPNDFVPNDFIPIKWGQWKYLSIVPIDRVKLTVGYGLDVLS